MEQAEYQMIQDHLVMVGRMLEIHDLDGFLEAARRSDSVGWILDPTLARDAGPMLGKMIKLAEAAQAYKAALAAMREEGVRMGLDKRAQ